MIMFALLNIMNIMPQEKRIDEIKRLCEEIGVTPSELFRTAQIPYSTLTNWDRKEPDAFTTYDKLKATIELLRETKPLA